MVHKKKPEKWCEEIKAKFREPIQVSLEKSIRFMKSDTDNDVELTDKNRRMLVKCALTYLPMTTPAKGMNCDHLDCFNLETWAATNESCKVKKWRCPFCGKKCYDVVIDSLWLQILEECKKHKDAHEVELRPDGHFRVIDFNESKAGLGKLNSIINQVSGKSFQELWIAPRTDDSKVEDEDKGKKKREHEESDNIDDGMRKISKLDCNANGARAENEQPCGNEEDPIEL